MRVIISLVLTYIHVNGDNRYLKPSSSFFSTPKSIKKDAVAPNIDKIFGKVLGQIGFRFIKGASPHP